MGLTAEAHARAMRALLPPGRAWVVKVGDLLGRLLLAAGDEAARVDGRSDDLLAESDPRTTSELLTDYERIFDLATTGTTAERVARVVGQFIRRQRVRPVDFQDALAPILGLTPGQVVIVEISLAEAVAMGDIRQIYRFFVWRDPSLPGSYDLAGADALIDQMQHSHTQGRSIESINFLADDPFSLTDRDLLGV